MNDKMKCPKCKAEMEKGVIADRDTNFGVKNTPDWGTRISFGGFGLMHPKQVVTYRCTKCGFLESYAPLVEEE